MRRRRKPLHILQFVAGIAMFPLAIWLYLKGDLLGVGFALVAGAIALAYTSVNLFVRDWP
jgi:hypothetical protein